MQFVEVLMKTYHAIRQSINEKEIEYNLRLLKEDTDDLDEDEKQECINAIIQYLFGFIISFVLIFSHKSLSVHIIYDIISILKFFLIQ